MLVVYPNGTIGVGIPPIIMKGQDAMKSILEEFAQGNINPEPRFLRHNSEYEKAVKALSEAEKKLDAVLDDNGRELLKALIDAQGKVSHLSNTDKFIYGYRLGVLMTMEVFDGKADLLTPGQDW